MSPPVVWNRCVDPLGWRELDERGLGVGSTSPASATRLTTPGGIIYPDVNGAFVPLTGAETL
jgi:hypothetical protein